MAGIVKPMGGPSGIFIPQWNLLFRFEGPDSSLRGLMALASKPGTGSPPGRYFVFRNFFPPPIKFDNAQVMGEWFRYNWNTHGELLGFDVNQTFERIETRASSVLAPFLLLNRIALQYPFVEITYKHVGFTSDSSVRLTLQVLTVKGDKVLVSKSSQASSNEEVLSFLEL